MLDRRMIIGGLITLALLTSLALPAQAEMYRYRDPATGRWVLTNREPPADAEALTTRPSHTPQERVYPVPAPEAAPEPPQEPVPVVVVPAPEPPPPAAKPVDTREFGLLKVGMRQPEVERRLGPPATVTDLGTKSYFDRTRSGRLVKTEVVIEAWDYPGSRGTLPVRVIFHNGVLAAKVKGSR